MNYLTPAQHQIVQEAKGIFQQAPHITFRSEIPEKGVIPTANRLNWIRVPDVTCCFVDMVGSTTLSIRKHEKGTARIYQFFTGTLVDLFHERHADYIDVKGDGVFALFSRGREHQALAAAITAKTFVEKEFIPTVKARTTLELGAHIGIDRSNLLVRTIGLKRSGGRSDRQNEVWAGKAVNVASKLAGRSPKGELWASPRFFEAIEAKEALMSCGCKYEGDVRLTGLPR